MRARVMGRGGARRGPALVVGLPCARIRSTRGPDATSRRALVSTVRPRRIDGDSTPVPGGELRLSPVTPRFVDVVGSGRRGDSSPTSLSAPWGASLYGSCAIQALARRRAGRRERGGGHPPHSTVPPPARASAPQAVAGRNSLRAMGFCARTGGSSRLPRAMTAEKMIRLGGGVGNRTARSSSSGGPGTRRCCRPTPGRARPTRGHRPPTGRSLPPMPTREHCGLRAPCSPRGSTRPQRQP